MNGCLKPQLPDGCSIMTKMPGRKLMTSFRNIASQQHRANHSTILYRVSMKRFVRYKYKYRPLQTTVHEMIATKLNYLATMSRAVQASMQIQTRFASRTLNLLWSPSGCLRVLRCTLAHAGEKREHGGAHTMMASSFNLMS